MRHAHRSQARSTIFNTLIGKKPPRPRFELYTLAVSAGKSNKNRNSVYRRKPTRRLPSTRSCDVYHDRPTRLSLGFRSFGSCDRDFCDCKPRSRAASRLTRAPPHVPPRRRADPLYKSKTKNKIRPSRMFIRPAAAVYIENNPEYAGRKHDNTLAAAARRLEIVR